jgi:16S rRNA (uracil1498-N3)-methyltransferase
MSLRATRHAQTPIFPARVNLILFEASEIERPLPRSDRRAVHILSVLRRNVGDTFDVGLVNGPRGKATLTTIDEQQLVLGFTWGARPTSLDPITLIIALPRPQTARDILRDATALGVAAIHFVRSEKSESSYGQSSLWTSGEWRRHVIAGAEQAVDTALPDVTDGRGLDETVSSMPADGYRFALDNYESPTRLSDVSIVRGTHLVLALGAERGWSAAERDTLRGHQFAFVHLGPRVLRTETATVAAVSIIRSKLGLM